MVSCTLLISHFLMEKCFVAMRVLVRACSFRFWLFAIGQACCLKNLLRSEGLGRSQGRLLCPRLCCCREILGNRSESNCLGPYFEYSFNWWCYLGLGRLAWQNDHYALHSFWAVAVASSGSRLRPSGDSPATSPQSEVGADFEISIPSPAWSSGSEDSVHLKHICHHHVGAVFHSWENPKIIGC